MTSQINLATASQLFEKEVTLRFQNAQFLEGTIIERHGTSGVATNVPVSDLIEMQEQTFAPTDIPVVPVTPTNKQIVPVNYALKTVIGGGEQTLFDYNMIISHAELHAKALGRMVDYIKIKAIIEDPNYGSFQKILKTVGAKTGLDAAKLAAGLGLLEANAVNVYDNVSLWMPAALKAEFMDDDKVVNFFYNDRRPLVDNRFNRYLGVDIRTLGNVGINSLVPTTNAGTDTYLVPLVAHDAMVQIFNRDPQTSIHWMGNNDRYELVSVLTSGASVIQQEGIVLLQADTPQVANP